MCRHLSWLGVGVFESLSSIGLSVVLITSGTFDFDKNQRQTGIEVD